MCECVWVCMCAHTLSARIPVCQVSHHVVTDIKLRTSGRAACVLLTIESFLQPWSKVLNQTVKIFFLKKKM